MRKAFAFSMLFVCVLVFAGLTIQAWRDGEMGFVVFGSLCVLMFIVGCVSVARAEDEPTAEELRDSDEMFYDAREQFIETKLEWSPKFWVAIIIAILAIVGFLVYALTSGVVVG